MRGVMPVAGLGEVHHGPIMSSAITYRRDGAVAELDCYRIAIAGKERIAKQLRGLAIRLPNYRRPGDRSRQFCPGAYINMKIWLVTFAIDSGQASGDQSFETFFRSRAGRCLTRF